MTTYVQESLVGAQPLVQAKGATLDERFAEFHRLNPWVLQNLEALASAWVAKGLKRLSVNMLFETLRHQSGMTAGIEFRLDNSYRSRYARLMLERHPEWVDSIETRDLPSRRGDR